MKHRNSGISARDFGISGSRDRVRSDGGIGGIGPFPVCCRGVAVVCIRRHMHVYICNTHNTSNYTVKHHPWGYPREQVFRCVHVLLLMDTIIRAYAYDIHHATQRVNTPAHTVRWDARRAEIRPIPGSGGPISRSGRSRDPGVRSRRPRNPGFPRFQTVFQKISADSLYVVYHYQITHFTRSEGAIGGTP